MATAKSYCTTQSNEKENNTTVYNPPPPHQGGVIYNFFAFFKKQHISANQVYFQEFNSKKSATSAAPARVAAKFSSSKNHRNLNKQYYIRCVILYLGSYNNLAQHGMCHFLFTLYSLQLWQCSSGGVWCLVKRILIFRQLGKKNITSVLNL